MDQTLYRHGGNQFSWNQIASLVSEDFCFVNHFCELGMIDFRIYLARVLCSSPVLSDWRVVNLRCYRQYDRQAWQAIRNRKHNTSYCQNLRVNNCNEVWGQVESFAIPFSENNWRCSVISSADSSFRNIQKEELAIIGIFIQIANVVSSPKLCFIHKHADRLKENGS